MPTVLRVGSARFFFYSNERGEPPHVHIEMGGRLAKLWLLPVRTAARGGLRPFELRRVARIVEEHQDELLEAWNAFFSF